MRKNMQRCGLSCLNGGAIGSYDRESSRQRLKVRTMSGQICMQLFAKEAREEGFDDIAVEVRRCWQPSRKEHEAEIFKTVLHNVKKEIWFSPEMVIRFGSVQTVDISVLERKHRKYVRYVIIHSLISRLKAENF